MSESSVSFFCLSTPNNNINIMNFYKVNEFFYTWQMLSNILLIPKWNEAKTQMFSRHIRSPWDISMIHYY